jgi:predicted peptidase
MMRKFFLLIGVLVSSVGVTATAQQQARPTKPGEYKLKYVARIDGKPVQMAYALVLPKGYDTEPARKFPMVVFMHGAGECGTDAEATFAHGPGGELRRGNGFKDSFPFIVLQPQCPPRGERWDQPQMYKAVSQIVDAAIVSVRVDVDRVYLTGLSMGGKGCWLAALEGADRFAAIAPICAGTVHPDAAEKLKYVAVWMIAGSQDGDAVTHNADMMGVLGKNMVEVRNTVVPGADHMVWPPFYGSAQFYEWMLSHKRPTAAQRKALEASGPFATRPVVLPKTAGHYRLILPADIGDQHVSLICSVYLPKGYSATGTPSPAILFLHDSQRIGVPWNDLTLHGPDAELEKKGAEGFKAGFPFVVISPQMPVGMGDWSKAPVLEAIRKTTEDLSKSLNIDGTRIYAMGLNDGAAGAWQIAADAPKFFAAVAPVVSGGELKTPENAEGVKDVPTWVMAADVHLLTPLFEGKEQWRLTVEDIGGVFSNKALYAWLLKQKVGG